MDDRNRIVHLILIMMVIATAIGGVAIGVLYETSFEEQRTRLVEAAKGQARLIEAMARFNQRHNRTFPGGPEAATLAQLEDGHRDHTGFGDTGEFVLARRSGGNIVFLVRYRHAGRKTPEPVAFGSTLAEPMRRALSGKSGTVIGADYRGETVLAAYEPVGVLNIGIVAKIDLAEIRSPFIMAGGLVVAVAVVLIGAGTFLFVGISRPMVRHLHDSEKRFDALARISPVGVFYTDPKGNCRYVNQAWCALTGLSPTEAQEKDWLEAVHPDDQQQVITEWADCVSGERTFMCEFRFLHPGGVISWVVGQATAQVGDLGDIVGYMGTFTDVTELKDTEQKLLQAQKMEAVGQLTGGIAHDFNNILAVVLGNLEFLDELLEGDERARKVLARATSGVRRGSGLTERLLAFSRRQHLEPELLDITGVVSGIVDLLRRTLGENISVQTAFAGDLSPVMADRSQLENAILNLAVNSRDAMPEGGFFIVDSQNITIIDRGATEYEFLRPGAYVILAVSDTGRGMPPEVVRRVFEPFFTTKEAGMGSGLGLSMVYGFTKQSNGYVTVDSRVGHGTTVKLYLPAAEGSVEARRERAASADGLLGGDETVLVVEDEPEVRALAVEMLETLGYTVFEASDGPSALDVFEREPRIDLLFTDVVMPGGLSGKDLAREVDRRSKDTRVLFTSGYPADRLDDGKPLDTEVKLLRKPYSRKELAESIRAVLENGADGHTHG